MIRVYSISLILFIALSFMCRAATNNAASVSLVDVTAAYNASANGDTIQIPAGNAYWTNGLAMTKAIRLLGSGFDNTRIFDARADRFGLLAFVNTVSNGLPYQISGIRFSPDGTNMAQNAFGLIQCSGFTQMFICENNWFDDPAGHNVVVSEGVCGVVGNNKVYNHSTDMILRTFHNKWGGNSYASGHGSWYFPLTYGTTNAMYVEANYGSNAVPGTSIIDGFSGARVAVRFNNITNATTQTHGLDSTGTRGSVQHEVYGNTNYVPSLSAVPAATFFRSGGGVVCSNTWRGYQGIAIMLAYGFEAPFWYGGHSGTNNYDSNNPSILLSGTATGGTTLVMTDSGASWTPGQWKGKTLRNMSVSVYNGVAVAPYSYIITNTATTITYGANGFGTNMLFSAGQSYQIREVLEALDGIGRGPGDLLSNANPPLPAQWPNEELNPFYYWANTLDGNPANATAGNYPLVTENVTFYNGTPKPGWAPLSFPHPLLVAFGTGSGSGCSYSILPTSISTSISGTNDVVSITTSTNTCPWTSTANASWLHVTGGSSGTGDGSTSYSVDANSGGARSGTITIAGQTFLVIQDGLPAPIVVSGNVRFTGAVNLKTR